MMYVYDWEVVLRDETMGFQKTARVEAAGVSQAIPVAIDALVSKGYKAEQFVAIKVERGSRRG
jgi:hypothetical protein